ncbi:MAG: hypothetical protein RJQ14_26130 [Marinoscillum sp.]
MKDLSIENDYAIFRVVEGIMHFTYKDGTVLDLNASRQVVGDRLKVQGDLSYPVVCDIRGLKGIDKEARDYLAKEGSEQVQAVALIIDSPARKLMSNFYLAVNKPLVPTKLFTSEDEAVAFLKSL